MTLERQDLPRHRVHCKVDLIRSGPDLRAIVDGKETFYDYTTCHITAPSHMKELINGISQKTIINKIIRTKCDTYSLNFPQESFSVIIAFELGGLDAPLVDLVRTLAKLAGCKPSDWLDELAVTIASYNADAIVSGFRAG